MSAELLAPVLTGDGRSGLVVDCPDHAIPFGVIFDEYKNRRPELELHVAAIFQVDRDKAWTELRTQLKKRNRTYHKLTECKKNPNSLPSRIDKLEALCRRQDRPLKELLHRMNGSALCLSGGGIRSASFGLGILEGLARFSTGRLYEDQHEVQKEASAPEKKDANMRLLHSLDYLSTVSGGGYIGSWLSAWVFRRHQAVIDKADADLKRAREGVKEAQLQVAHPLFFRATSWIRSSKRVALSVAQAMQRVDEAGVVLRAAQESKWDKNYGEVLEALAGGCNLTSGDPAPQPVRHLREYTSYLAPALGFSLDTWDLVAIVFRNLIVNWLMLVPLLLGLVALPQISDCLSRCFSHLDGAISNNYWWVVLVLFAIAATFGGLGRPSYRAAHQVESQGPKTFWVAAGFAMPVLLGNWLVAQLWRAHSGTAVGLAEWRVAEVYAFLVAWAGFAILAGCLFYSYRLRELETKDVNRERLVRGVHGVGRFLLTQLAALASAGTTTALLALLAAEIFPALVRIPVKPRPFVADDRLFTLLALPLVTLVPMLAATLFSGLLGVFELEEDREWLSRVGGLQLAVITGWVIAHAIALYAQDAFAVYVAAGTGLGGVGSALGWSGATSAGPRPVKVEQLGKLGSFLKRHDLLLPSVCAIALVLLAMAAAAAERKIAGLIGGDDGVTLGTHLLIFLVASAIALILNWAININLFSLHGMYRMRLMRAFLGASNTQRKPDNFTQFDPRDTPREKDLPDRPGVPLHIINTTLNLVGTKNLAWRQRKAESFTFSSLYSGAWRRAYVPTSEYAGAKGVSLATAMAISGAAFNPNMGYHSSPLVTLLMTFFNVRLGWWLPNPARELGTKWPDRFLHQTGPTFALVPLIREALGKTDETYRWIELTDGAHFENLGLYEMVLRRCHRIIVVDAGADPKCQFEDLGNALRKIEIDLGIPISFNDGIEMKSGAEPGNRYCAVATINYACVDAESGTLKEKKELEGKLIYIKAGITGGEPPDIKQYALTHEDFPHETTANQFFNESQFESYRHLGSYQVEQIVNEGLRKRPRLGQELEFDFSTLADIAEYYAS